MKIYENDENNERCIVLKKCLPEKRKARQKTKKQLQRLSRKAKERFLAATLKREGSIV